MALDEENLGERFHDYELEDAMANASESQLTTQSATFLGKDDSRPNGRPSKGNKPRSLRRNVRPRWTQNSPRLLEADEGDDEVPASLLVEGADDGEMPKLAEPPQVANPQDGEFRLPGASTRKTQQQWETARAHQQLHPEERRRPSSQGHSAKGHTGLAFIDPKEKAMWRWANVENLDNFLKDVYEYFLGNGLWCIIMSRVLNLL